MNCWDILGIEPTNKREHIRQAYEWQIKFASGDEAEALNRAYREATGQSPAEPAREKEPAARQTRQPPVQGEEEAQADEPLGAADAQVVREVIIQIKALMNDNYRQGDPDIWRAVLCEPPADQPALRREIGRQLEHQVRPMAENGGLPGPVSRFLGDWFGWLSLREAHPEPEARHYPEPDNVRQGEFANESDQPPQMMNFWPAVIGWIVGLAILAAIFGGMGGG